MLPDFPLTCVNPVEVTDRVVQFAAQTLHVKQPQEVIMLQVSLVGEWIVSLRVWWTVASMVCSTRNTERPFLKFSL